MKKHVLHRLNIEVNAPTEMNGKQLQQDISNLVKRRVLKIIESTFDKIGTKKNIRIPKLELEINAVQSDNWEDIFIKNLSQQLFLQIKNLEDDALKPLPNSKIYQEDSFLYFLKNGTSPWWDNSLTASNLRLHFKNEMQDDNFQNKLIKLLSSNENARYRLVFQFKDQDLYLLFKILEEDSSSLMLFFENLKKTYSRWWQQNEIRLQLWNIFFKEIIKQNHSIDETKAILLKKSFIYFSKQKQKISKKDNFANVLFLELKKRFLITGLARNSMVNLFFKKDFTQNKNTPLKKEELTEERKNSKPPKNKKNKPHQKSSAKNQINNQGGYYIDNAGLVILHPFFQYLFDDVGFTKNHQFIDQIQQHQAALALHYLVTGNENAFEPDLVFNKILCNIPIENPIENQLLLNEKLQIECENLIKATIQHWSALKSTSIEGLRNTFLQREGKISQKENGDWLLQVQSLGVDILLSKLPWGIGMIKLPWMDGNLFVEWA